MRVCGNDDHRVSPVQQKEGAYKREQALSRLDSAGTVGLLVGTGGAGLFDLYLLTAALALLGLGRLLVFLFVFALAGAFAGRLWVELLLFVFSCPSLAPADAGRSKFVRHTITMASLACEIGKSVRDLFG